MVRIVKGPPVTMEELARIKAEMRMQCSQYKSRAAREAEDMNYGDESYWHYLDEWAIEHDMLDRSLSEALQGNDGE